MKLQGKTAIVTGGARNIGQHYCRRLAEDGAQVVAADILDCSETVEMVQRLGGKAIGVTVDVQLEESVAAMVEKTLAAFGGVDVLVHNAALYGGREVADLAHLSVEMWDRMMAINMRGTFLCTKLVAAAMRKAGKGGSIINISSGTVFGQAGSIDYVSSKAGVIGITRSCARELGPDGIRVNAVTPGFTLSQASVELIERVGGMDRMREAIVSNTPLRRLAEPADMVGTVSFLASDDSAFITGQIINVDGGWVMH